jgi:hypothetical protein
MGAAIVGPDVMYSGKECLKQAGWTHVASGDGSGNYSVTAGNVNDQITGAGAGANGFNNTNAWWIGADPSGNHEVLIQRGTTDRSWKVGIGLYGMSFSGGAPSATVPPTIPTATVWPAGGTSSFATLFPNSATWKAHFVAEDTAHDGVYGFWLWFYNPAAPNTCRGFVFFEPTDKAASTQNNFAAVSMPDSATQRLSGSVLTTLQSTFLVAEDAVTGFERIGTGNFAALRNSAGVVIPSALPAYSYDSPAPEELVPMPFLKSATPYIFKGVTKHLRWNGGTKQYPDTADVAGAAPHVFHGECAIPWPTGVTPT